jgi:hypothetical protein
MPAPHSHPLPQCRVTAAVQQVTRPAVQQHHHQGNAHQQQHHFINGNGHHAPPRPTSAGPKASITFRTRRKLAFGEVLKLVGSAPELGCWDCEVAPGGCCVQP